MVSDLDVVGLKELQKYRANELPRIQTRAEKWIPGLAAVTAVLTTAIVVKGATSFTGLDPTIQTLIIGLMTIGGLAIGAGVLFAYSAAHGSPFRRDELAERASQQNAENAYRDWNQGVKSQIEHARRSLSIAVVATLIGTALLAGAVIVTWFAPSSFTCISTEDGIVKLEGVQPKVVEGELLFTECT